MAAPRILIVDDIPKGYEDKYPWKIGDPVLRLGEIENMPGHVAVVTSAGVAFTVARGWIGNALRRLKGSSKQGTSE